MPSLNGRSGFFIATFFGLWDIQATLGACLHGHHGLGHQPLRNAWPKAIRYSSAEYFPL
jgi:hypothetical protein